jgi:uncharacterized membrane protein
MSNPACDDRNVGYLPDETNLDPAERGLSVTLGLAMLAFSASRGRSLKTLILAAAGGYLAHRGVTGRCALYERLEAAQEDERLEPGDHVDGSIEAAATVARPVDEVYAFWRALENAPRFMAGIDSVEARGPGRSLWTAHGPAGDRWQWEAEILEDRPGELLVWRSLPGSDVHHQGAVRFAPAPGKDATEVRVAVELRLPGGAVGRAVARLGKRVPELKLEEDLRRLKQLLEAGETPVGGRPRGPDEGEDEDGLEEDAYEDEPYAAGDAE